MQTFQRVSSICLCGLLLLCGTALAQDGPVGTVSVGFDSLSVFPAVPYGELRITIAGKGGYFEERYTPDEGTTLFFGQLEDGPYKYEIIAAPNISEAIDEDGKMDPAFEGEEKANTFIQSGSFTVAGSQSELNVRLKIDASHDFAAE